MARPCCPNGVGRRGSSGPRAFSNGMKRRGCRTTADARSKAAGKSQFPETAMRPDRTRCRAADLRKIRNLPACERPAHGDFLKAQAGCRQWRRRTRSSSQDWNRGFSGRDFLDCRRTSRSHRSAEAGGYLGDHHRSNGVAFTWLHARQQDCYTTPSLEDRHV